MRPLLEDKVALMTGAASGIGRATALLFAAERAVLVLADVDEAGCVETARLVGEQEQCSLLREEERRRPPDARGRSGDECDFALEERPHPLSSPASSTSATPEM